MLSWRRSKSCLLLIRPGSKTGFISFQREKSTSTIGTSHAKLFSTGFFRSIQCGFVSIISCIAICPKCSTEWEFTRHSKENSVSFIAETVKAMSVLVKKQGLLDGKPRSVNVTFFEILVGFGQADVMTLVWNNEIFKYLNLQDWLDNITVKYFRSEVRILVQYRCRLGGRKWSFS